MSGFPDFILEFYYEDGTVVTSGKRKTRRDFLTGELEEVRDINFLRLGYIGEGPRYAIVFLRQLDLNCRQNK